MCTSGCAPLRFPVRAAAPPDGPAYPSPLLFYARAGGAQATEARADVSSMVQPLLEQLASALTLTPYEYCNQHGLWAGEATTLLPWVDQQQQQQQQQQSERSPRSDEL